ncbi:MAG: hypothetical protein AB7V46_11440, partial [Thermomicrobiales bacterium]
TITILLEYRVNGVIRTYPDAVPPNQQLWWTAISHEVTDIAEIDAATVSIHLPESVDPEETIAGSEGIDLEYEVIDNQIWRWSRAGMSSGDEFIVRLQFPPVTSATEPSWQDRLDQQAVDQEAAEERSALLNLLFLAIGGLAAIAGAIILYGIWYTLGRDPHAPPVATFLTTPPDDLAPGTAGALLDEVVQDRDIIATLLDLASRNILTLVEKPKEGLFGSSDFTMTLGAVPETLRPYEQTLLTSLFGSDLETGKVVTFSQVKQRFVNASDHIRAQLYDELVTSGYFHATPESVRVKWRGWSSRLLIGAAILSFVLIRMFASDAGAIWLIPIVALALALAIRWLSEHMPRKTVEGAEAAEKWRAFQRYLDDIETYEKLGNHTEIFERYLPFVVAFGIEESWVRKFAAANTPPPTWFEPAGTPLPGGGTVRPGRGGGPVIVWGGSNRDRSRDYGDSRNAWPKPGGGGGGGFPDLQDMSDSAARGLSSASSSLFDMLSTAAEALASSSSGGGGGRKGGGFGGGGFGGGGFSGGGSRGGSSGGGSRGFR